MSQYLASARFVIGELPSNCEVERIVSERIDERCHRGWGVRGSHDKSIFERPPTGNPLGQTRGRTCGVLAAEVIRETQVAASGVCRFRLERRRSDERAFGHILVQRQSSGSGSQQLPVLRHNHDIDAVNDAVCRDQIGMFDPGPIDPQVER